MLTQDVGFRRRRTDVQEVFLTPGLVVGTFPVEGRLRFGLGIGMQVAVSQFHRYNHRLIASVRLLF